MLKSPTSKPCPKAFKGLGIHLKHCSQRCGREYQTYLSQKTLQKKAICLTGKSKKKPCGKCGKLFRRLDNHLRNSCQCRMVHLTHTDQLPLSLHDSCEQISSQFPSSPVLTDIREKQGLPTTTEHPQPELNIHPEVSISDQHSLSLSLKAPFHCPESKEEWQLADEQLTSSVIPCVLAAGSVDEKCQVLCLGVYEYFSAKYGTRSKTSRKKKRQKYSKQEKALIREERNKARQQLRKAKRNSSDPESIRELARKFHLYLRQYSRLNRAESSGNTSSEGMCQEFLQRRF